MYPGAAKGRFDFGHFIWSNATLSKFLVVNIYGAECGHWQEPPKVSLELAI